MQPYRYAVVYGTATLGTGGDAALRRRLAHRYLGRVPGDMYVAEEEKRGVRAEALRIIAIVPDRFVAHDFAPDAGLLGRLYFRATRWLRPVPA